MDLDEGFLVRPYQEGHICLYVRCSCHTLNRSWYYSPSLDMSAFRSESVDGLDVSLARTTRITTQAPEGFGGHRSKAEVKDLIKVAGEG